MTPAKIIYVRILQFLSYRLGFRISLVKGKKITDSHVTNFNCDNYYFRIVLIDELVELINQSELDMDNGFIRHALQRDDQCLGAFYDNDLVGYSWRTDQPTQVDGDIFLSFCDRCYYRYKGFVLAQHRGKGLLNYMKSLTESKQIAAGKTLSISCIETHNYPSLAASKKGGDYTIGYSAYLSNRFGFWSWSSPGAKKYKIKLFRSSSKL